MLSERALFASSSAGAGKTPENVCLRSYILSRAADPLDEYNVYA